MSRKKEKIMFVARIYNNRLGNCVAVSSIDEGVELIQKWVADQFSRELTEEELNILRDEGEFYNDDDPDNIFTFALGYIE